MIPDHVTMICDPDDPKTDFFLLRDGPVLVMSDHELLRAGARWLQDARTYRHHEWLLRSEEDFYREVSKTLSWKEQFGYSPWSGNLDSLNDGLGSCTFGRQKRVVITIDKAERLKIWFGNKVPLLWDMFQRAARVHLLFGVGLLLLANTSASGEAVRWARAPGVSLLSRRTFPGAALAEDAGLTSEQV